MSTWYLTNLHHKSVAFNLSNITMQKAGIRQNAIEIALAQLSSDDRNVLVDAAKDFLLHPETLNLNEYQFHDLSLVDQFAVITQALNHNDCLRIYPDEKYEAVDINILIKTTPFVLSLADLFTAYNSTIYQISDERYHPILVQILKTLKRIMLGKNAGYSDFDELMKDYGPNVTLIPEAVITALRMSNALMLKTLKLPNGKFDSKTKISAIHDVYKQLMIEFINTTPQEAGYDEERNMPIFSVNNPDPVKYLLNFKNGYKKFRLKTNRVWLGDIEKTPFLESLAYSILIEFGHDPDQVAQLILDSKANPLKLFDCPTMSQDNNTGVYKNILLINAVADRLEKVGESQFRALIEPLTDHLETCYMDAPDARPRDIRAKYQCRKSVGRLDLADHNGQYKFLTYAI